MQVTNVWKVTLQREREKKHGLVFLYVKVNVNVWGFVLYVQILDMYCIVDKVLPQLLLKRKALEIWRVLMYERLWVDFGRSFVFPEFFLLFCSCMLDHTCWTPFFPTPTVMALPSDLFSDGSDLRPLILVASLEIGGLLRAYLYIIDQFWCSKKEKQPAVHLIPKAVNQQLCI